MLARPADGLAGQRSMAVKALFLSLILLNFTSVPAAAQQLNEEIFAYGEHLASQCAPCHARRNEGAARISRVPDIWSMDYDEFAERFTSGKSETENESVRLSLEALSEGDVEALLYYFRHRR